MATTYTFGFGTTELTANGGPKLTQYRLAKIAAKVQAEEMGCPIGIYKFPESDREAYYPGEFAPQGCSVVYPTLGEFIKAQTGPVDNLLPGEKLVEYRVTTDSEGFGRIHWIVQFANPEHDEYTSKTYRYTTSYVAEGSGWGSSTTETLEEALQFLNDRKGE